MSKNGCQPLLVGCLGAAGLGLLTTLGGVFVHLTHPRIPIIHLLPFVLLGLGAALGLVVWGAIRQSAR